MSAPARPEDDDLQRRSDRIERLLDEIERSAPAPIWRRVEDLMEALVGLYGGGLARLLEHHRDAPGAAPETIARVTGDDFLSSLLLLHGLHPLPVEERVRRAIERARGALAYGGAIELARVDEGMAVLRLGGGEHAAARWTGVARALEEAIAAAAPELSGVRLEGQAPATATDLLPVERLRRRSSEP